MAATQPFYETPVDRTPYGACALVTILALVVFVLGAFIFIRLGSIFQHFLVEHGDISLSSNVNILPTTDPFSSAQQELDSIEQTAQTAAKQAVQAQATAAANQLQNAAQASVEKNVDNLKNGIK